MRLKLSEMSLEGVEVRQGASMWYPAAMVVERFERLDREGVYLRGGDQMVGPFTPERSIEIIDGKKSDGFEARIGLGTPWIPVSEAISKLKTIVQEQSQPPVAASSVRPSPPSRIPDDSAKASATEVGGTPSVIQTCVTCGTRMNLGNMPIGKLVACPKCKTSFRVNKMDGPVDATKGRVAKIVPVKAVPVQGIPVQGIPVQGVPVQAVPDSFDHIPLPATPRIPPLQSARPVARGYQPSRYEGTPTSSNRPTSSRQPDKQIRYLVPGIIILCWSGMLGISLVFGVFSTMVTWPKLEPSLLVMGLAAVEGFVLLILIIVLSMGGWAMVRQENLSSARTAAVLAAIPCFGCLFFPVGIWACVSLFSEQANRDFHS